MQFSKRILAWYKTERRDLPWRQTSDPYKIWLSEVILQQTRIDQGMGYYLKFIDEYPDIQSLARADEKDVLKLWQGLGYYSRARNLCFAARQVVDDYGGQFPETAEALIKLKGIGDYTAAAIASIAFNQKVATVDGNVKRVMARVFGLKEKGDKLASAAKEAMQELIDPEHPGDFNQSVMEFGAIHCTPKKPACEDCIFREQCYAFAHNMVEQLPVKQKQNKPRQRYLYYLLIKITGKNPGIIIRKRTTEGIWKNLYDFPLVETGERMSTERLMHDHFLKWFNDDLQIRQAGRVYDHQLTHRSLQALFYVTEVENTASLVFEAGWEHVALEDIPRLPVPRLIDRFMKDHPDLIS